MYYIAVSGRKLRKQDNTTGMLHDLDAGGRKKVVVKALRRNRDLAACKKRGLEFV
jgi:hypothetical protein